MDSLLIVFPIIADLFNLSLNSSTFPSIWKLSYVTLPKRKTPLSPADFRPISFLCHLFKILERLVFDQLSSHLHHHQLLDPLQTDFRRRNSTQTVLVKLTDDIRLSAEGWSPYLCYSISPRPSTRYVMICFCVSLLISAYRSRHLGSSGPTCRADSSASTDPTISLPGHPSLRAPRAPYLAHYYFFIDDLRHSLIHSHHLLYADDLQIYLHFPPCDFEIALRRISEDVAAIERWSSGNGLMLNAKR